MELNTPSRGYFSGPEGKVNATTWGVIGLIAFALIYLMGGQVGDYLVSAADNTLHLVIACSCLLFIAACLMDPKRRCYYIFRSLIRWLTSMFIELDPIGIRKTYVERMQAKYEEFTKAVGDLRGQLRGIQRLSAQNKQALGNEQALFAAAVKQQNHGQQVLHNNQQQRLGLMDQKYTIAIDKLTGMQTKVLRCQEICGLKIEDLKGDIAAREQDAALARTTRTMSGSLRNILRGLPEEDMYNEAGGVLDAQYDAAMGEFDNILDLTRGVIESADLQDTASLDAALAKMELSSAKVEVLPGMKQIAAPALQAYPTAAATVADGKTTEKVVDYSEWLK